MSRNWLILTNSKQADIDQNQIIHQGPNNIITGCLHHGTDFITNIHVHVHVYGNGAYGYMARDGINLAVFDSVYSFDLFDILG